MLSARFTRPFMSIHAIHAESSFTSTLKLVIVYRRRFGHPFKLYWIDFTVVRISHDYVEHNTCSDCFTTTSNQDPSHVFIDGKWLQWDWAACD